MLEIHYKYLHENPELSGLEFNTSRYVLETISIYKPKIYRIGLSIVAYFDKEQTKTLAIRSELDALPIKESTSHQIYSKLNMHACGHDIHTASLLTLCKYINNNKFSHNMALIFQSKEETGLGSRDIIETNIFDELNITETIGLHVWPNLEFDTLFSNYKLMYGSYELDVTINGHSNHISTYNKYTDATYTSYLLYKKMIKYKYKKIAHLGKINSGIMRNISSNNATLEYSIRFKNENNIKKKILNQKLKTKCNIEYDFKQYYPPLICNKLLLSKVDYKKIKTIMAAEDFGYYGKKSKIIYLLYGLGKGFNLHTKDFITTRKQRKGYYNKLVEILNLYKIQ